MSKYFWTKLAVLGLFCAVVAQAAEGMKVQMNGSAEAGFAYSWQPSTSTAAETKDTQWGVDDVTLALTANVTDKTKVVVSNSMSVGTAGLTSAFPTTINSTAYRSNATLNGAAASRLAFANNAAYIDHKCAEGIHTWVGHFGVPFGLESMSHRYDSHTYYYSSAYNTAQAYSWYYDTGFKVDFTDVVPGALEFAVVDGRDNGTVTRTRSTPAVAARYQYKWESGDMSLSPTFSTFLSRWRGGPKDLGLTVGTGWKMGMIWANFEWVYTASNASEIATDPKTTVWSLYVEPGVDLGMINLSAKLDIYNAKTTPAAGNSDLNLGVALSKSWDAYRIRLTYQHLNFSSKGGRAGNDVRLLFGTKW